MANNDAFNGSTVTFPTTGATIGSLRGIGLEESAAEVDVTSSDSTSQTFVTGIPKSEISLDIVGGAALATASTGTEGALDITWHDGSSTGTLAKVVLTGISVKGSMDSEITATLKFANASTS